MARSQFFVAVAILGLVILTVLWDTATAIEGAALYAVMLTLGIIFVRAMVRRRSF